MEENLFDHRKSYEKAALTGDRLEAHPMQLFKKWFDEVEQADTVSENNAMTISTVDDTGFPKNRIVLLKEFNDEGFVFYTNYTSEKGKALLANPKMSLSFFWPSLERQVIVRGEASKLSVEKSDAYFASRPRGSQLGAWASHQSKPIANQKVLRDRMAAIEKKFANKPVLRPDFWGGFLVKPLSVEFWQGRPNRLHDRFKYVLEKQGWQALRLAP